MSYVTKVLLLAIAEIVKSSETTQDVLVKLAKIANAEGVIIDLNP